jgi:multidrug efflux pump subunit AcrB
MEINWSALDGVLGVVLVIVVIWAALKLVKRLVIALVAIFAIGTVFFGMHWSDFFAARPDSGAAAQSNEK